MNRPTIVLPCFIDGKDRFIRLAKWLRYMEKEIKPRLNYEKIVLLDNASEYKYLDHFGASVFDERLHCLRANRADLFVIRFEEHLPRSSHLTYPYWWRALYYMQYLHENLFFQSTKYITIDSDLYLLKDDICNYINELRSGWVSFQEGRHKFATTELFVLCEDTMERLRQDSKKGFMGRAGETAENAVPFTHVETRFHGGRYPEDGNFKFVKGQHSFLGQVPNKMRVKYGA